VTIKKWIFGAVISVCTLSHEAYGWGRRGHQMVGETAAMLVADDLPRPSLFKEHSYDLAYYCNVPDFIWKRPETYEMERAQHFMDLEIFDRAFAKKNADAAAVYALPRAEFEKQFPEVDRKAGRAFWRIREMVSSLETETAKLRELKELKGSARQELQGKWIVLAGTLGHYVGDLSQPMHVSENYDGQMTGQRGLHKFYEDDCVDELYPKISPRVMQDARTRWKQVKAKYAKKTLLELLHDLTDSSQKELRNVLTVDKKNSRENVTKACGQLEGSIRKRLVEGSLVLAEIYRRNSGWPYDGEKFYFFAGEPAYIPPGISSGEPKP